MAVASLVMEAAADVISRKAAAEAKNSPTDRLARLAAELESAVAEMLRFAGEAGFAARWPVERVSAETSVT